MDLRSAGNVETFGLVWSPMWFVDTDITRSLAEHVRRAPRTQAIIVPSIAFFDDHLRWIRPRTEADADTSEQNLWASPRTSLC